jgi:nicotinamidase/pyrazinamidase
MGCKGAIFWDVDTQRDFLSAGGRLYVPGAANIIPAVSSVRKFALVGGYSIIASIDYHSMDDPEISLNPDFKTTFPPHCLAGDPGGERLGYLGEVPVELLGLGRASDAELRRITGVGQFHIVLKSNTVDIFDNPNARQLLNIVQPQKVVVFGVALDVCVRNSVLGLLDWGGAEVFVITDAVRGLQIRPDEQVLAEFADEGAKMLSLAQLDGLLGKEA